MSLLAAGRPFPQAEHFSVAAEVASHVGLRYAGVAQASDGESQVAASCHHLQFGLF